MNIFEESYSANKNLNEDAEVKSEEIFKDGNELVAIEDIYYSDLNNMFFSDEDIKEYTDLGFIKNNALVFPKGTKFKVLKAVGPSGWPTLTVDKTGDDFEFAADGNEERFVVII